MRRYFAIITGVLVAAFLAAVSVLHWIPIGHDGILGMLFVVSHVRGFMILSIAIAVLLVAAAVEWNDILNHRRVSSMASSEIRRVHLRLPPKLEIIMASILTVSLLLLFVQFIATVYAMSFTLSSSTSESKDTRQIILGDFDGDGDLDYIAGNKDYTDTYLLDLYTNNGSGVFTNSTFGASDGFETAAAGDIDGDGDLDLVQVGFISGGGPSGVVYKNNGSGVFSLSSLNVYAASIVLMDVENDGDLDAILASSAPPVPDAVLLNNGHGIFVPAASTLPRLTSMASADFNSDGYQDLAITQVSNTAWAIYLNSGTGSFTPSYVDPELVSGPIITGDFDGDGAIDVAFSDTNNEILIYANNGLGTSFLGLSNPASNLNPVLSIASGDIDNDGDLDLIASGGPTSGGARLFLNDGNGIFTENGTATETLDLTFGVAIGDIDADGDLDYIRGNDGGGVGEVNRHYKSDQAATSANTAPVAPSSGFGAVVAFINNTITTVDSVGQVGGVSSIAIPSDGLPIISYDDGGNGNLKVIKCGNASCSSGNTISTVDSLGMEGTISSIAIPSDGLPVIGGIGTNSALRLVKCGNASCSSGNITNTIDLIVTGDLSMAIPSDDLPIIAYYDTTIADLKVVKCGDATCASGNTITTVDSVGDVGSYVSIVIPSDGLPVISYLDTTNVDLKVLKCGDASCSSGNTITTVVSTGQVGFASSIALSADSFPIVSYFDDTDADLEVVKCGDASCSSGNSITTVEGSYLVGLYSSITVPSDGLPIISYYYGFTTYDLRILKCGDASCASGNTITTVDSEGSIGLYPSIAVPSDGLPIISYHDSGNDDLKVLKCSSASCSSGGSNGLPSIRLSWGSGSDTQTAVRLLQYQLQVGTGSNANNIISSNTASPNWVSRVMPNGQSKTELLRDLPCGHTFYWSVAAVDTGFKSTRSSEQTFTLDSNCGFSGGGGGGGGASSAAAVGGGSMWRPPVPDIQTESGFILVSAYEDINGNGVKDLREKNGFAGLVVTASGSTASGKLVRLSQKLSQDGETTFELEKSDDRGYALIVESGSVVLTFYVPTVKMTSLGHIIRLDSRESVAFGFRRQKLLDYKPCLSVGEATKSSQAERSDSLALLSRLEDAFSLPVLDGVMLDRHPLVTRGDFLTMLARTQCIPLSPNPQGSTKHESILSLIDLSIIPLTRNAMLVYSLLAADLPAARLTSKGPAADLSAPITRREAIALVTAAMKVPEEKRKTNALLPKDLPSTDLVVSDFSTLSSLGVLPPSFLTVLGLEQGIDANEAATILTKAAFQAGHISLLPIVFDTSGTAQTDAVASRDFLSDYRELPLSQCLLTDSDRASHIVFRDLLPGDVLESSIRDLLSRGTKNSDGKILWLLAGTGKPTEFGVEKGETKIQLDESPSLFEILRTLLVLRCLPPPSAKEAFLSGTDSLEGSAGARVPRDLLSGLPRDTTFLSRVFYRSQDHERMFDLSLFSFAHDLMQEQRKPDAPMSLQDASKLLASATLNLYVHDGVITSQDAENKVQDLAMAIARHILHDPNLMADSPELRLKPLTRRMLLEYLNVVLSKFKKSDDAPAVTQEPSLGEVWWERLK